MAQDRIDISNAKSFVELAKVAAMGDGSQLRMIHKSCESTTLSTSSEEDVWAGPGQNTYQTSADTVDVVSNSANDTSAGTGARTIRVYGLDADFNEISEDFTMNGTSAVSGSENFLRVNHVRILTAGSLGKAAGLITVDGTTTNQVMGYSEFIGATSSEGGFSHFCIPAGWTGFLLQFSYNLSASGADGPFEIITHKDGLQTRRFRGFTEERAFAAMKTDAPIIVPSTHDLKFIAWADNGSPYAMLSYSLLLVKGDYYANYADGVTQWV